MNRYAVQQSAYHRTPRPAMHAIGSPAPGQRWCSGQKQHMPPLPGEFLDSFKSRSPRCFRQMIMAKDYTATPWQSPDRLLEKRIIPLIGKQPYLRQGRTGLVGQDGAGLVSQHKQAYRRKLGERE